MGVYFTEQATPPARQLLCQAEGTEAGHALLRVLPRSLAFGDIVQTLSCVVFISTPWH